MVLTIKRTFIFGVQLRETVASLCCLHTLDPLWQTLVNVFVLVGLVWSVDEGGLKGVVWTDVIQTVIMFFAMVLVVVKGTMDIGGIKNVFKRNWESDRIEGPNSLSTGLNAMAAVVLEDFYKPFFKKQLTERQTFYLMSFTVLVVGTICIGMVFVVEKLGTVLQLFFTCLAVMDDALPHCADIRRDWREFIGLRHVSSQTSYCCHPFIHKTAKLTHQSLHHSNIVEASRGDTYRAGAELEPTQPANAPTGIELHQQQPSAPFLMLAHKTRFFDSTTTTQKVLHSSRIKTERHTAVSKLLVLISAAYGCKTQDEYCTNLERYMIYRLSYLWYSLIGTFVAMFVGLLVSSLTKPTDPRDVDPLLLAPFVRRLIKSKAQPNGRVDESTKVNMLLKLPIILFIALTTSATEEPSRWPRSLQPGAPNVNNKDQPWQLDPHIERDKNGNTRTGANVKHHGDNHDFDAGWSKVVRGPNKAKPTWHVGGTYRWRRSLQPGAPNINNKDQPWQLDPHIERDENGNTRTGANVKHHGDNHDFDAGWSKVVRGPSKAKPTWHVGGTYRWRRSLQPGAPNINNKDQPWQLDPHIERDENGNTRTGANVKHHGDNHDFDAGWSKVVRGPSKAKPTWHVGGTYRWRRSLQPGAPNINNKDQPWQLDPHIERDDNGNTRTGANVKHHGDNHDFDAGWSKVVRGPNKAKPTWHVGDQPWQLDPHIERDENGNTRTGANVKHHGDNHDFDAGWSKVVRGPSKAKPTWHVGGTYRWRRSLQPGAPNIINKDQPWQLDPHIERDENGNTRTGANVKHHGDNHDFDAGWSKVVRGPSKAKPTWHVGGTYRWRRSIEADVPVVHMEDHVPLEVEQPETYDVEEEGLDVLSPNIAVHKKDVGENEEKY
ncbi:hypothetical protein NQ317_017493 [Molorchus minor]|uniref:Uncharacterized protein n=1 Tax=Molorchus minor TaxID=1323400 RepID=A0ABQ9JKN1_9CUCU|nr:hypothetical protein NQ317_017493 [Molorchus minor]